MRHQRLFVSVRREVGGKMKKPADWEEIKPLGGGGQSDVFLVRNRERQSERANCLKGIRSALDGDKRAELAVAIWSYARPDLPSELGALKVFKIPPEDPTRLTPIPGSEEYEAIERLKNEIAVLSQKRPGLPKLLDSNAAERWIVTEYFPERTLEHHPTRYKGRAALALKAFRSLVKTTAFLHNDGYVHRDIKPANVFISKDDELVLGDFGIAYVPNAADRVTLSGERVGPRDYMPPWANLGVRQEKVEPCSDVYMLGKLLWSMVDGRVVLPREYYNHREFDLRENFPDDPDMYLVNEILDHCVVEQPSQCLSSAQDLLIMVDTMLRIIERGGQLLWAPYVPRPCHVCGNGHYEPQMLAHNTPLGSIRLWLSGTASGTDSLPVRILVCSNCGHVEFFKTAPS
jgi:serine/threonine protein kinase